MVPETLQWRAVRLSRDFAATVGDICEVTGAQVVVTRLVTGEKKHVLAAQDAPLQKGQELLIHGTAEALDKAIAVLGHEVELQVGEETGLMYSRFTVSNPDIAGRTIEEISPADHGFAIARVRKGDNDYTPRTDTVLNYSDRVRVVAAPSQLARVRRFLGDSESALGNADLLPMSLGLLAGMLIGIIPIPLPGGTDLTLGFGGGPIVIGLLLGYLNRTGPINWQMPFHTRQAMSNLGLTLFLAGVGTSAGASLRDALTDPSTLVLVGVGFAITIISAVAIGVIGVWGFRLKWDEAMGVSAGMTTNPAVFAYINTQTGTELPGRGYATVYPTTVIGKIIAAQVLLMLLL